MKTLCPGQSLSAARAGSVGDEPARANDKLELASRPLPGKIALDPEGGAHFVTGQEVQREALDRPSNFNGKIFSEDHAQSRDIPFNRLVLSQSNVRRIKAGVSIEELAQDIARRTLLQSLTVRPVLDDDGAETGMFEVPAGGRRYRALELLVKQKRLSRTAPVPCVVRTEGLAEEDSLAENVQRAPHRTASKPPFRMVLRCRVSTRQHQRSVRKRRSKASSPSLIG
jgi:hypothetical protein